MINGLVGKTDVETTQNMNSEREIILAGGKFKIKMPRKKTVRSPRGELETRNFHFIWLVPAQWYVENYANKNYADKEKEEKVRLGIDDGFYYFAKNRFGDSEISGIRGDLKISDFPNLKKINYGTGEDTYNKLNSLEISNCPQLEEIWCANNQLKRIKIDEKSGDNLKRVHCAKNQITDLNGLLKSCNSKNLQYLDLSNNPLSGVERDLISGFNLGELKWLSKENYLEQTKEEFKEQTAQIEAKPKKSKLSNIFARKN